MKPSLTQKFSFNNILVDPQSNSIYLKGVEKRLEPKLMDLLVLLAAQDGAVISRQEITDIIWSEVVVGEESITRAIFALRNALGDDAKRPQYIETIPKKGYRFLGEVELVSDRVFGIEPANQSRPVAVKSYLSIVLTGSLALILLAFIWSATKQERIAIESVLPLSKMEGVERDMNLDASGETLLFIHDDGKTTEIVSRNLITDKKIHWVKDQAYKASPIWIDNKTIAYISRANDRYQLIRFHQGQAPQVVYTSEKPIFQLTGMEKSPDDIFFLEFQHNDLIELKSFNLRNGSLQNWRDLIPQLPKKMGQLAYSLEAKELFIVKDENVKPGIIVVNTATRKVMDITGVFNRVNKIFAVSERKLLVAGALGANQGLWFVEGQKSPELVLRNSGSDEITEVQMDVKRNNIFYAHSGVNQDIEMISGNSTVIELPELNSSGVDSMAVFSGDNTIYFISNRTGYYEIWRYEIDSKSIKQISSLNAFSIDYFSLSHDGRYIAVSYRTDNLYLGVIDGDEANLLRKTRVPSHRFPLAWSRDNKTLYVSEHEAEVNLYTYDLESLTETVFAKDAGLYVDEWDDQYLVYVDYARHGLVKRNSLTQQEELLHNKIPNLYSLFPGSIEVDKDQKQFYAQCDVDWLRKLCAFSLSTIDSPPKVLKSLSYELHLNDISTDGEKVLVTHMKPPSGDIMRMQIRYP